MATARYQRRPTAQAERRRQGVAFGFGYGLLGMLLLALTGFMRVYSPAMGPAMLVLLALVGLAILRPAFALGAVIVLAVVGDAVSMPWWPVTKNLSSAESIMFIANPLTIKPIDIVLITIAGVVVINRRLSTSARPLRYGPLLRPMLVFMATIAVGLIWGLSRGGDLRIAYFEVVPLLYIPVAYFAATNLFTSLAHYRRLMIGIIVALTVESLHTIPKLESIKVQIGEDQSAFEHSAATHLNLAILLFVAIGWFGAKRRWPRLPLILALIPIVYIYLDGERRAGIVALIIGGTVLAIVLSVRDHQRFLRTVPAYLLVITAYSAAFWGASGQLGFPAQAVRSVVQPDSASQADSQSDLYRDFENFDLNATIRSNPLLGVGFGKEFLQPIPLPEIGNFFEFADYIPHNTLLWIWVKTGLVGFVSFIYMSVLAIAIGIRAAARIPDPVDASVIAVLVSFVPMALIVAYVDISGEPTTMTLLGLAMAAAGSAERLITDDAADGFEPDIRDAAAQSPVVTVGR